MTLNNLEYEAISLLKKDTRMFSKKLTHLFFISALMLINSVDARQIVFCRLETFIAPDRLFLCPDDIKQDHELFFLTACPGAKIKLNSFVENNCSPVKYQWFRASIIKSKDELPKTFSLDENGQPVGHIFTPVGNDPKLCDTLPSECPFRVDGMTTDWLCCGDIIPTIVYVLVTFDPCTGCYAISNPVFVTVLPCADLEINNKVAEPQAKKSEDNQEEIHNESIATFEVSVTNNGPCTTAPKSIVVRDTLPCDVELLSACADREDWDLRIILCDSEQFIQAVYRPELSAPCDTDIQTVNTTSPIFITVKCQKDCAKNTATVYSTCPNQFDCNLGNNTSTVKARCLKLRK